MSTFLGPIPVLNSKMIHFDNLLKFWTLLIDLLFSWFNSISIWVINWFPNSELNDKGDGFNECRRSCLETCEHGFCSGNGLEEEN